MNRREALAAMAMPMAHFAAPKPLFGWFRGSERAHREYIASRRKPFFRQYFPRGSGKGRVVILSKFLEQAMGKPFVPHKQGIGDCVSHAFATGADVLTAVQIYSENKPEEWKAEAATEPIYGGSRVEIGGMNSYRDGSTGYWGAEWISRYGILLRQPYPGYDFTTYDPKLAKKLGRQGCPDALEPLAKLHPVKTTAIVRTWTECRDAVCSGFPIIVCSNVGFGMSSARWKRDSQGFLRRRGSWNHAMLVIGIDDKSSRPGALLQNSWGDVFTGGTRHEQPAGSFWVDASTINSMMRQGDSHAISAYDGYPAIPDLDYNLW